MSSSNSQCLSLLPHKFSVLRGRDYKEKLNCDSNVLLASYYFKVWDIFLLT